MSKSITGGNIQQIVANLATRLPDATCTQPFGPEYDVFKVKNKVFAMTTEVAGKKIVTLKCDPERSIMLREIYDTVTPGYHMNKRHWISIAAGADITQDFVTELVTDAYKLVVATLPRRDRPT
ncbi:MmcQ/YjbR family DNA-binding protein [Rhizobium sp. 2YAF20]|uniref:MmcQ/YjbR family DNA-binding protein n=1 Tax=Rhizobium sp. 2YAF20 TaxID=3233027 RepID=UPI003F9573B3